MDSLNGSTDEKRREKGDEGSHLCESFDRKQRTRPHDADARVTKVTHQGRKKIHDLFFLDGTGIDAKIELPQREAGSDRQTLPIEVVLQDGGLSARCPGTVTMRSLTQSAFVDEDEDTPLPARFFFAVSPSSLD